MQNRLINLLYQFKNLSIADLDESELADYLIENNAVAFPCSPGDTVYRIMADKRIKEPYKYKVMGIWYSAVETCSSVHLARFVKGVFESSMSVPFSEFGKIVFLTREEAEERQKELKDMRKEDEKND